MIDQEVKNGIPSHRIILGGFSQARIAYMLIIDQKNIFLSYKCIFVDTAGDSPSASHYTYLNKKIQSK